MCLRYATWYTNVAKNNNNTVHVTFKFLQQSHLSSTHPSGQPPLQRWPRQCQHHHFPRTAMPSACTTITWLDRPSPSVQHIYSHMPFAQDPNWCALHPCQHERARTHATLDGHAIMQRAVRSIRACPHRGGPREDHVWWGCQLEAGFWTRSRVARWCRRRDTGTTTIHVWVCMGCHKCATCVHLWWVRWTNSQGRSNLAVYA